MKAEVIIGQLLAPTGVKEGRSCRLIAMRELHLEMDSEVFERSFATNKRELTLMRLPSMQRCPLRPCWARLAAAPE